MSRRAAASPPAAPAPCGDPLGPPMPSGADAPVLEARLPAFLRAERVSRHTRIVLYVLAVLNLVMGAVGYFLGPSIEAWLLSDPAVSAAVEAEGGSEQFGLSGSSRALGAALTVVGSLVTLLFAWQPSVAASVVLIGAAFGLFGLVGADHPQLNPEAVSMGTILGAAMVARYSRPAFAWTALGALLTVTVVGEVLADGTVADETSLSGVMTVTAVLALMVAVPAVALRRARTRTRAREAAVREAEARAACAAEAERQRIAAELHDVVAHGLTVISMQAAMLPTQTDPERRAASEKAIEEAARQSLVDLRRMLTALRGTSRNEQTGEADAAVDLTARLDEFESRLHAAGFSVERSLADLDHLPRSMELTVLRVVQESVTNILKHTPRRGTVRLRSRVDDAGRLVLEVISPLAVGEPRPGRVVSAVPSGFGLAGMRERVAVFGGTLVAGPEGEGWTVRAVLPTR